MKSFKKKRKYQTWTAGVHRGGLGAMATTNVWHTWLFCALRYPKRNTVALLYSKILPLQIFFQSPNFWLATPLALTFLSSSKAEELQSKLDYIELLLRRFSISNQLTIKLCHHLHYTQNLTWKSCVIVFFTLFTQFIAKRLNWRQVTHLPFLRTSQPICLAHHHMSTLCVKQQRKYLL